MNQIHRAARVFCLSLFPALLLALPLGAIAQSDEAGQAEVAAKDSAKPAADVPEKTDSEFQPMADPDLVVSDRVSDSIPESSLSEDAEDGEPIPEHAGIEEIMVTAEKRSSSLQTTPTAITALTGAQLFDRGIYDVEQLATQVPNFQYGETFGIARITIRGVGNQGFTDPSTAFHIDGIYQNNPTAASALTFYDLAGVEVLRGPQGTLWGRNSTAGAINVSTRRPIHELEIFGDVLGGSYNEVSFRGVVNVPIFEEVVALRVAGYVQDRDGYQENLFYPGDDQNADDAENWGLRPQVLFEVTDDIKLVMRGMYNHQGGVGFANKIIGDYPSVYPFGTDGTPLPIITCIPPPGGAPPTCGDPYQQLDAPLGWRAYTFVDPYNSIVESTGEPMLPNPEDPRQIRRNVYQFQDISTWDVNGTLEWDLTLPYLGDAFLNVVGSYREENRAQNFDGDLSEQSMSLANVTARTRDRVIDAHIRSADDAATQWLLGFFMLDADGELDTQLPGDGGYTTVYGGLGGKICPGRADDVTDLSTGLPPTDCRGLAGPFEIGVPPYPGYALADLVRIGNPGVPAGYFSNLQLSGAGVGGSNDTLSLGTYINLQQMLFEDRLTVSLGVRFNYDRVRATRYSNEVRMTSGLEGGAPFLGQPMAPLFDDTCIQPLSNPGEQEEDWAEVTGDLKVDYIPSDEHMVYASISKGYKPGYINGQAVGLGCGDPAAGIPPNILDLGNATRETIWAFEVGSKNRFFDDSVQANLTGFYYRFENFQVLDSALNSTFVSNADRARIWGIEFEGIWMPTDELTLSVVYGYLNAKYTDYYGYNFATGQFEDFSGNSMIRAPEHQATLAAEYLVYLNSYGNLIPRIQWIVSDKIYFTAANTPAETEAWFGNLQIRLRWETVEENLFVEGFVENLTNENIRSTRQVGTAVLGAAIAASYQPPRIWGIRIGGTF